MSFLNRAYVPSQINVPYAPSRNVQNICTIMKFSIKNDSSSSVPSQSVQSNTYRIVTDVPSKDEQPLKMYIHKMYHHIAYLYKIYATAQNVPAIPKYMFHNKI